MLNVEQLDQQDNFLAVSCQKQFEDFLCQLTSTNSSVEEVDEEVVGDAGEVLEAGDAEERGVEGEGEQRWAGSLLNRRFQTIDQQCTL